MGKITLFPHSMNVRISFLLSLILGFLLSFSLDMQAQSYRPTQSQRKVLINQQQVPEATLRTYERQYGMQFMSGSYWYDPVSGLWGYWGGPTVGAVLPNVNIGGRLSFQASGGMTNVVINGRSIHPKDLAYLQSLGPVYAGRYWLDAYGNYGFEGGPMLGNLVQAASYAKGRSGGRSTMHRNWYTGVGSGSDGTTSYVIGKDFSVIVD